MAGSVALIVSISLTSSPFTKLVDPDLMARKLMRIPDSLSSREFAQAYPSISDFDLDDQGLLGQFRGAPSAEETCHFE